MNTVLLIMVISTVFFIIYARLCVVETNRGRRLWLPTLRGVFDNGLSTLSSRIHKQLIYIGRYMITLSWYYSLHAFLRVVLKFIAGVYTVVEAILHSNRDKARKIRTLRKREERSHLSVLAEHKIDTTLTASQKEKRKAKALSGK